MTNENILREPPYDLELEKAVLGLMLIDKNVASQGVQLLKDEHFYSTKHQKIFNAMIDLFQADEFIGMSTLVSKLKQQGSFNNIGIDYLNKLIKKTTLPASIDANIKYLIQKYIFRQMILICKTVIDKAYLEKGNAFDLLDKYQTDLFKLYEYDKNKKQNNFKIAIMDTVNKLELKHGSDGITGLPTGFNELDKLTGGLQNSDLIILAGRPRQGKSAIAMNIVRYIATYTPVAVFSIEMSEEQLLQRFISSETGINLLSMRTGNLKPNDWEIMQNRMDSLLKAKITIDDTPAISLLELRAKAKDFKREKNIGLIVVDYLQQIKAPKAESREREISIISANLKVLAKELNIPVLALCQLNRNCETRTDKRPLLADLRESGSLEQDADLVCFIHRPELYKIATFVDNSSTQNIAEFIIAKARSGPEGEFRLYFDKSTTSFKNDIPNEPEPF